MLVKNYSIWGEVLLIGWYRMVFGWCFIVILIGGFLLLIVSGVGCDFGIIIGVYKEWFSFCNVLLCGYLLNVKYLFDWFNDMINDG